MTIVKASDKPWHYCMPALKRYCERNGIDFRKFVQEGVEESVLPPGCPLAAPVIENAKKREENNGR